ncbi:MAG: CHASE2 domain-containing protein [Cyanobacteriota bacterium]
MSVIISSYSSLFIDFNNNIYDYFLQLNRSKNVNKQIVIVKIDEKTIKEIGQWPISRNSYSDFLDIIFSKGAKAAGFYLEFSSPSDSNSNQHFINSLKKFPVTLLTPYTFNIKKLNNKYWNKIENNAILAHDVLNTDKDEVVRNISPIFNNTPSFSLAILNLYDKKKYSFSKTDNVLFLNGIKFQNANTLKIPVNFKTPWFDFRDYSLIDILNNKFPESAFKDKIVLLGLTKERSTGFYKTPFSKKFSFSGKIAPIFIQAQIIDSILNFDLLYKPDVIYIYLILLAYVPFIIILLKEYNIIKQIITLCFISLIEITLSFATFKYLNCWIFPLYFISSNIYVLVFSSIISHVKVSKFLDSYIGELTHKTETDSDLYSESSVDNKLITLKKITTLIEYDRDILDTVLNSVRSLIVLFDEEGKVIYSNSLCSDLNLENLLPLINFHDLKTTIEDKQDYHKFFNYKNKEIEFIASKARENLFTGVFNDITEISQINETKHTIVRMLSHELKTPLTSILLCCDAVIGVNTNQKLENYINRIINQTEFIKEIITDFLELNKIEISEFQLHKTQININELINFVISGFEEIIKAKDITIKVNVTGSEDLQLSGDKKYLTILFKNLIDNAIKYSPDKTEIAIHITSNNDNISISIKDQGFGMEEKYINKLFQKFYRIKTDQTEHIQGTGLGLSFVKKIVELHNGTIEAQSQINAGSTFIVTLPLKDNYSSLNS